MDQRGVRSAECLVSPPRKQRRVACEGAPRSARAVTLIELLAAVALMGLLLALVLPRLANSSVWRTEGDAAAKEVASTMRLARQLAVDHGADCPSGYLLVAGATSYRTQNAGTRVYGPQQYLPDGWKFERSDYTVWFDAYGGVIAWTGSASAQWAIYKNAERWLIRFDPSTGYTWHEKG